MRTDSALQPTVQLHEVKAEDGRLFLSGSFSLECPLPAQGRHLPGNLEQAIEAAGQEIKRRLFQQALEHADLQAVLRQRHGADGQGVQCRGSKGYTFKTVFGTIRIRRRRVLQKGTGHLVVPSARAWETPPQVCLTPGLQGAICEGMLAQSARATVARLEGRAGEEGLLSHAEVLAVVQEQGQQLQAAWQQRAEQALAAQAAARQALLPEFAAAASAAAVKEAEEAEEADAPAAADTAGTAEGMAPPAAGPPLGFPGTLAQAAEVTQGQPRHVDAGWVLVEPDEVKVHAQPGAGCRAVLVYTAVVLTAARTWHLCAPTPGLLRLYTGSLLAAVGAAEGRLRVLFLADGARWIRDWFEGLRLEGKAMILCWYHLVKRCEQLLSMACRGRAHRAEVQEPVLEHLWHGRLDEALGALRGRRGEMKNEKALDEFLGYLEARRPYLPDYAARRAAGLWIASNRVEKFNDWGVSERCKHQGMAWTVEGVNALALLEASRRNGELQRWQTTHSLPPWQEQLTYSQAA